MAVMLQPPLPMIRDTTDAGTDSFFDLKHSQIFTSSVYQHRRPSQKKHDVNKHKQTSDITTQQESTQMDHFINISEYLFESIVFPEDVILGC